MIHSMILVCNTEKINRYIRIRIRISMDASRAADNFMLINHLRMTLTMFSGAILNMHLLMLLRATLDTHNSKHRVKTMKTEKFIKLF